MTSAKCEVQIRFELRRPQNLAIVETAFRGGIEEQYGHILWLGLICRGMKLPLDVVLCQEAARYALQPIEAPSHLCLAGVGTIYLPDYAKTIHEFLASDGRVYVVQRDIQAELDAGGFLLPGVTLIDTEAMTDLMIEATQTWFW